MGKFGYNLLYKISQASINNNAMKQIFIMLVGFSRSGKSTLVKKILKTFPNRFVRINSDTIHAFLNKTYPIFQDDNTIQGKSYELRQEATKVIYNALLDVLLKNGHSVILDSCNLSREKRGKIITNVKKINKGIKIVIIYNEISEDQLYKNLRKADQQLVQKGAKPTWVDLYKKIQKPKFEKPQKIEADHLFVYTRKDAKDIFNQLKIIITK